MKIWRTCPTTSSNSNCTMILRRKLSRRPRSTRCSRPLSSCPQSLRKRSTPSSELLAKWGGALAADGEPAASVEPATNGVKHDEDEKPEPAKEDSPAAKKEESPVETTEKKDDAPADSASVAKPADTDGDVTMGDADKELSKDEPAVAADAETGAEASAEAATSIETAPATDAATS
jgi:hypothetical protein